MPCRTSRSSRRWSSCRRRCRSTMWASCRYTAHCHRHCLCPRCRSHRPRPRSDSDSSSAHPNCYKQKSAAARPPRDRPRGCEFACPKPGTDSTISQAGNCLRTELANGSWTALQTSIVIVSLSGASLCRSPVCSSYRPHHTPRPWATIVGSINERIVAQLGNCNGPFRWFSRRRFVSRGV
jgi:hypothetical protein